MALVDDRGRLFGRLNLIDAAVLIVLFGLIPLSYLGIVLFRQPQPALVSVNPTTLSPQVERAQIKGRNLRQYLRISFNEFQGRTFALIDDETAEVQIPQMPPGQYDVILYDVAREISRLPGAVTVQGPAVPPSTQAVLLLSGRFVGLDENVAAGITPGTKLSAVGGGHAEVLARGELAPDRRSYQITDYMLETPLVAGKQLPALIRTTCAPNDRRCHVGGINIEPFVPLPLFLDGTRPVQFIVSDAASDGATRLVNIQTTFILPNTTVNLVRAGDRARRDPLFGDRVPVVISTAEPRARPARVGLNVPGFGADEFSFEFDDSAVLMDAVVRVRADVTSEGLQYRGHLIRAGSAFSFDHERYVLRGWIRRVEDASQVTNEHQ